MVTFEIFTSSNGYWKNDNRIYYAKWLGKKLGYKTKEDWYNITAGQIVSNRGSRLLDNYYHTSPQAFLMDVFQTMIGTQVI